MISPDYVVPTPKAPAKDRNPTRQSWKLTPESKAAFQKEVDAIRQTHFRPPKLLNIT